MKKTISSRHFNCYIKKMEYYIFSMDSPESENLAYVNILNYTSKHN